MKHISVLRNVYAVITDVITYLTEVITWLACCEECSNAAYSGHYHKRILHVPSLSAFAKFRKATISFVMSFLLSVLPLERLGSNWKDFHGIGNLI